MALDPASIAIGLLAAALTKARQMVAARDGLEAGAGEQFTPGTPQEILDEVLATLPTPAPPGDMRDPFPVLLEVANSAVLVLQANARKKYALQNLGPGEVHVLRSKQATGGFVILPDGFWSDDAPFAHNGDVYCWATLANTTVIVTEWT